jgi:rhodanese-related sulfurtransferase
MSAGELAGRLGAADEQFVLDVREPAEVAEWAIAGSVNIPLGQLAARASELPRDREIVAVCASGNRSAAAAAELARAGYRVANLRGGMSAWGGVHDVGTVGVDEVRIAQGNMVEAASPIDVLRLFEVGPYRSA